ncbi:MAG: hypothetical protein IPM13_18730 [Phycisphaerales bacterium]|nr:hypothetical protein [Phycisphaerales bacterium]
MAQPQWTFLSPVTRPSARTEHAMVWDAGRGLVVLFGGNAGARGQLDDTWEWDGNTWLNRTPASSPPRRAGHSMAYDARRGVVVLFGGYDQANSPQELGDTWEWDGVTWRLRGTSGPGRWAWSSMCYDAMRGRTVLFGGGVPHTTVWPSGDTWEWDGATWTQRASTGPAARARHAMAYDAARGVCVMFGGEDPAWARMTDTWEWNGSTWTQRGRPSRRRG